MRPTAGASPTTREGGCTCSTATTAVRLCRRRGDLPARRLQPARERLHRLRLPSGVREERALLHDSRRTRAGEPVDAQLHPARVHRGRRDPSQHHHGVACDEPGREHVRGHAARAAARRPHRADADAPDGQRRVQPTAKPGSPDYGLLYTSGSDLGFSNGAGPHARNPAQTQRLDSVVTAILRIDPRSPSVTKGPRGSATTRFRRGTYSPRTASRRRSARSTPTDSATRTACPGIMTDGTMFALDIGMDNIEEVNIVRNGDNYGWMKREGYWENGMSRPGGALNQLFPLPADVLDGRRRTSSSTRWPSTTTTRASRSAAGSPTTARFRRCAASSCSATSIADGCSSPTPRR